MKYHVRDCFLYCHCLDWLALRWSGRCTTPCKDGSNKRQIKGIEKNINIPPHMEIENMKDRTTRKQEDIWRVILTDSGSGMRIGE